MHNDYESGFIGLKALADYLAISLRTVHRMVAAGELPSIKVGHRRLVRRSAIETWLSGQEQIGAR